VTVSDGGSSALGTATASSAGTWSFTTADLAAGSYAFTATDTTSAGTSAASSALTVNVAASAAPGVPVISNATENANDSVTVTGTALANPVVDLTCNGGAIAKVNVGSAGTWSFTTWPLLPALYWFKATDTTSGGTSAASQSLYIELSPTISSANVNSNGSVTLSGIAGDGSYLSISDGGSTALGRVTANSRGAWSFTTADLPAGSYAFTAVDSVGRFVSAPSSAFDVNVPGSAGALGAAIAAATSSANASTISANAAWYASNPTLLATPLASSMVHLAG